MATAGKDGANGSRGNPIFLSSDIDSDEVLKQPTAPKKRKLTRKQMKRKRAWPERRDEETETDSSSGSAEEPAKKKMKRATEKENASNSSQSVNEEESSAKDGSESESYGEEDGKGAAMRAKRSWEEKRGRNWKEKSSSWKSTRRDFDRLSERE